MANDLGVTIMKLLALTLGLLPLMAMAGQTINEQIDVPANKRIFIETNVVMYALKDGINHNLKSKVSLTIRHKAIV